MKSHFCLTVTALTALAATPLNIASAHGFAGERFFPATLTTDDPFVASELSLPTVSTIITSDGGGTRDTEISADFALRITDRFGIEAGERYIKLEPNGDRTVHGFGNLEVGAKYELINSDEHEGILSLGLNAEIGGTGRQAVGSDRFTTYTPAIFFGKGFGDLPASLPFLRPLALTGSLGVSIPGSSDTQTVTRDELTALRAVDTERHPDSLEYGFALEYSFIYLQEHVKDMGLKAPFDRMIPLVEFAFSTPLDRGQQGQTTGTISPGVIWSGQYCQIGAEAMIPVNSRTGSNVGVLVQLHFYLDDLLPGLFGKPLFGGTK